MPLSFLGLIFSSFNVVENFKPHRKNILFLSHLFIYILLRYDIFVNLGGYGGIIYIFSSISFFMGFYLLPLENSHSFIQKIIKQITSYTNGIYCLHTRINRFCRIEFGFNGTLKSCFIIYLISYFFSFIGIKLLGKTRLKYLFSWYYIYLLIPHHLDLILILIINIIDEITTILMMIKNFIFLNIMNQLFIWIMTLIIY